MTLCNNLILSSLRGVGGGHQLSYIFSNDIELEVYNSSLFVGIKSRMLIGIGNNGHLKGVNSRIHNGKTSSINSDRPFFNGWVAFGSIICKGKKPATIFFGYPCTSSCLVYMALNNMAIQAGT